VTSDEQAAIRHVRLLVTHHLSLLYELFNEFVTQRGLVAATKHVL
jgi:hypothetical protein